MREGMDLFYPEKYNRNDKNNNNPNQNKSLQKMKDYNSNKKEEPIDLRNIESKIKEKVENDKNNFKEKRKEEDRYYKSLGFNNYEEYVEYNKEKNKDEKVKYSGPKIQVKNIAINYDKNLMPMEIKENLKEIPDKKIRASNFHKNENRNLNDNNTYTYNDNFSPQVNDYDSNNDNKEEMLSSFTPSENTKSKKVSFA
jgi:hypothetical protein